MNYRCQHCHQAKATVHITDTMPEKHEQHLCEECAQKVGVIVKHNPHTTNDMLEEFIKQRSVLGEVDERACPKCGLTFREFRLKGLLGCPYDYEVFRQFLTPLIERAHEGATDHVGKVPRTADATVQRQGRLLKLRRELQDAVEQENYERAAALRDQISHLESSEPA